MHENLRNRLKRFEELERLLSDPAVLNDPKQVRVFAKEHSGLKPVADLARQLDEVQAQLKGCLLYTSPSPRD